MQIKRFGLLFTSLVALASCPALAAAPVPQVTGPVAAPDVPGAPTHNYIFFASNHDLASHGYVEEEYFVRGTADGLQHRRQAEGRHARRQPTSPITPASWCAAPPMPSTSTAPWWWNGTMSPTFSTPRMSGSIDWEHMMRDGYVWVGVSNQTIGVDALKKWNPKRYGEFDVGRPCRCPSRAAPTPTRSPTIFSARSARRSSIRAASIMLDGLKPKVVLATGESQSAPAAGHLCQFHPAERQGL